MIKKLTPMQASRIMGCSVQFVRIGMQKKLIDIGDAVQISDKRWTYNIVPSKLADRQGLTLSEIEELAKC